MDSIIYLEMQIRLRDDAAQAAVEILRHVVDGQDDRYEIASFQKLRGVLQERPPFAKRLTPFFDVVRYYPVWASISRSLLVFSGSGHQLSII